MPPKGTMDRMPDEYLIRSYIFNTRRKTCQTFWYEEYLTPLLENADIYRAKSGEDVGGTELTLINDRGGRDLAIRPEMTPSVTRMVSRFYPQLPKPIRFFSIANFYRNERPQKGRNREFWQLNVDMFGENSTHAEVELIQLSIEIMRAFRAPAQSFSVYINHRHLITTVFEKIGIEKDTMIELVRLLDKRNKLSREAIEEKMLELGLTKQQQTDIFTFCELENVEQLKIFFPDIDAGGENTHQKVYQELLYVVNTLKQLGYENSIIFKANLMRGFDYYNGIVFEIFDTHPDNTRALFWGGRYNGLATIFGTQSFPAVGFAPGDETMKIFLENRWLTHHAKDMIDQDTYYMPILDESLYAQSLTIATDLRSQNKNVVTGTSLQTLSETIQYANKRQRTHVVIFGGEEKKDNMYSIKNLQTREQQAFPLT